MKFVAIFVLFAIAVSCIEGGSIRPMDRPERPLERPEVPLDGPDRPSYPYKSFIPRPRPRPEHREKLDDVPLLRPRPNEDSAFPPLKTEDSAVPLLRPRPNENSAVPI